MPTPDLQGERDGIPLLNNLAWWYFAYETDRRPDDIASLWQTFEDSIHFADTDSEESREALARSFGNALSVKSVGVSKLTIGMFLIRPWAFPPLDKNSIKYVTDVLGEDIPDKKNLNGSSIWSIWLSETD